MITPRLLRGILLLSMGVSANGQTPPPVPAGVTPPPVGSAAPDRFNDLFLPFRTDYATLSPDGRYLAYSIRENEKLSVVIVEIDHPDKAIVRTVVATDATSTPMMVTNAIENTPARIRWMGWATPSRLVIETNTNFATVLGDENFQPPGDADSIPTAEDRWLNVAGVISAIDADGKNPRTLVTPNDVAVRLKSILATAPAPSFPTIRPDVDPEAVATGEVEDVVGISIGATTPPMPIAPTPILAPRSPSFFDYLPEDPDWILIRGGAANDYSLYKLNVHTAALRPLSRQIIPNNLVSLVDRQGEPRAAIASNTLTAFPHRYLVEKSFGFGRWNDLDKIAAPAGKLEFSLSPENYLGHRSFPVGFDEDPNVLYYASNLGRDTYGLYALDLKTGLRTGKPIESANIDLVEPAAGGFIPKNPLVFDRFDRKFLGVRYASRQRGAVWIRPEWREAQAAIEARLLELAPGGSVEIKESDRASRRFLVRVYNPVDPGAYYIYDRETKKLSEFVRLAPWLAPERTPLSINFEFDNPAGGKLTGNLSLPRAVRQKPIPILVLCAPEPWIRTGYDFQAQTHAFSEMGFAVLQLNVRGSWGFGVKHRDLGDSDYDKIQVEDIVTAVDTLSKALPLHPKRVAIVGERRGAYLALRAAQLRPDRFRCAIGIEPTIDLGSWLSEARWTSTDVAPALIRAYFTGAKKIGAPLLQQPELITSPIDLLLYRGADGGETHLDYLDARRLGSAVERKGVPVDYFPLSEDYMRGLPRARAAALRHMEDFINVHIYGYRVNLGVGKESR